MCDLTESSIKFSKITVSGGDMLCISPDGRYVAKTNEKKRHAVIIDVRAGNIISEWSKVSTHAFQIKI
jgi:hypothetical protein